MADADYEQVPEEVLRYIIGVEIALTDEGIGGKVPCPEGLLEAAAKVTGLHPCRQWDIGLINTEQHALICDCRTAVDARAARGL